MSLKNRVNKIEKKLDKKEKKDDFKMEINFISYDPDKDSEDPYSYISYSKEEEKDSNQ